MQRKKQVVRGFVQTDGRGHAPWAREAAFACEQKEMPDSRLVVGGGGGEMRLSGGALRAVADMRSVCVKAKG